MAKTTLETSGNKDVLTRTAAEDEAMPDSVLEDGSLDPVYEAKAKMLNKAIQDIGMGKYQWQVSVDPGGAHSSCINTPYIENSSERPRIYQPYHIPTV